MRGTITARTGTAGGPSGARSTGYTTGTLLFPARFTGARDATLRGFFNWRVGITCLLLFIFGGGLLAWNYALLPQRPYNYLLFWTAWGLCLSAIFLCGLSAQARARHHLLALAAYGAITWLPHYLRSPVQPIFSDELFHLQVLQQIAELGRTHVPITFYAIPGEFPGLEFSALTLAGTTGLSLIWSARLLTLALHMLIPALAYTAARGLALGRRGAFLAALVYVANTSYYFFHSVFSYETLGIVFVLAIWLTISRRPQRFSWIDVALAAPLIAALAATHHFSSYILAATTIIAWLSRRFVGWLARTSPESRLGRRERLRRATFGVFTALTVTFPIVWVAFFTTRTAAYLSTSFSARVSGIVTSIQRMLTQESGSRTLFQGSPLPQAERLIDFLYVPILVSLGLAGVALILWRLGVRHAPAFSLALAPCGPLAWFVSIPAVLTPASELAYRAWPFLFFGLALYIAVALLMLVGWLSSRTWGRQIAWPAAAVLVAVLLFGSVGIGDNQAGRFPVTSATQAAGPEVITLDLTTAARWLEATSGRYNRIAGDGSTQLVFATIGFQSASTWGYWTPFYATTPSEVEQYMQGEGVKYLAVDRRITQLPPRYGFYFSDAELYFPQAQLNGRLPSDPLPSETLDKFDRTASLARIYDNGNIQIFEYRDPELPQARAQPASTSTPGTR